MVIKPPTRLNVAVDVHPPARPPSTPPPSHHIDAGRVNSTRRTVPSRSETGDINADAIMPTRAPSVTLNESPLSTQPTTPQSIEGYSMPAIPALPDANSDGFRVHRGRRYVDLANSRVTLVARDPDTGLFRARLPSELIASGPLLLRDPVSRLWHPHTPLDADSLPLTDTRLAAFRTDLDFRTAAADVDGLFSHAGKRYLVIRGHAYQALQDLDASTPERAVWRIVKPADPVAIDTANTYNASRAGATLAVTRNERNEWLAINTGLKGGMPRHPAFKPIRDELMQRYQPIHNAHKAIERSSQQYDALHEQVRLQPEGSTERTEALIKLEVHMLKLLKMQADFVQSLIDNREWLKHLKASGQYKRELRTFQKERVENLNRLMVIMDMRVKPLALAVSVSTYRRVITHLNKKLKLLEDRQALMEHIKKSDPSSVSDLDELNNKLPGVDQIKFNQLTLYLRLLTDDSPNPPSPGMESLRAIDLFTESLKSIPEHQQPLALLLAVDQLKNEKGRFAALMTLESPEKVGYIKEIITLIEQYESKIESRLTTIYDRFERNTELPHLDQEIDFDFVPPQSNTSPAVPAPPRKMFRTRQHGTYKVLVGETEIAADGNVTLKVPDPFRPDSPPQRYEKHQGDWLPVRPHIVDTPRPERLSEARRLLAGVAGHLAEAKSREARKTNPTDILEYLGAEADRLNDQARLLENHQQAVDDSETAGLVARLRSAGDSLTEEGQNVLVRMYKNRAVLDVMRLNYLLDHGELDVVRKVSRKPMGKGAKKTFLDVYLINDRSDAMPLWEAHFHYEAHDSHALNFTVKGGHLKTLEQAGRGTLSQRRDEQAGLPHVAIWRETFDGKTAQKIFNLAA